MFFSALPNLPNTQILGRKLANILHESQFSWLVYTKIICFTSDCGRWNFFGCGEVHDFQTLLCDFNSRLKSRIHVSWIAIIQFKKFSPSLQNHFKCSCMILSRVCFYASVSALSNQPPPPATFFLNICSIL